MVYWWKLEKHVFRSRSLVEIERYQPVVEWPQSAFRETVAFFSGGEFYYLGQDLFVLNFGEVLSCAVSKHRMSCHVVNGDFPAFDQLA